MRCERCGHNQADKKEIAMQGEMSESQHIFEAQTHNHSWLTGEAA